MYRMKLALIPLALLLAAGLAGCQEQGGTAPAEGSGASAPAPAPAPTSAATGAGESAAAPSAAAPAGASAAPGKAPLMPGEKEAAIAKAEGGAKGSSATPGGNPHVLVKTSMGTIEAVLYAKKSPITVKNFLEYVRRGHYNGTIFHRVIRTFMIQGGGFTPDMTQKQTGPPIDNESGNGLTNDRGTLAMARTSVPDSATAQFFINVKNNDQLNRDQARDGVGYAVFGKVVKGMDVVDKIKDVPTGTKDTPQGPMGDVPLEPVVIQSITVK